MNQLTQHQIRLQLTSVYAELQQMYGIDMEIPTIAVSPRAAQVLALFAAYFPLVKPVNEPEEAEAAFGITVNHLLLSDQEENFIKENDLYLCSLNRQEDFLLPWEKPTEVSARAFKIKALTPIVANLLQHIADDPKRQGLADTPKRVAKAWAEWTAGYDVDVASLVKAFEDGAEGCDEMVIVKDIPIYSKCEHHLADIFGTATIAYIPNGKVAGLSKLSRLADVFARRLQVQERLTNQIADAVVEHMGALGVGVIIRARHMCMESRGICQQGHHTITSALRGTLRDNADTRAEFIALANSTQTV